MYIEDDHGSEVPVSTKLTTRMQGPKGRENMPLIFILFGLECVDIYPWRILDSGAAHRGSVRRRSKPGLGICIAYRTNHDGSGSILGRRLA